MEKTGSQNQNNIYDKKGFSSLLSLIDHAQDETEKTPEFEAFSSLRERALAVIKKVG